MNILFIEGVVHHVASFSDRDMIEIHIPHAISALFPTKKLTVYVGHEKLRQLVKQETWLTNKFCFECRYNEDGEWIVQHIYKRLDTI